MEIKSANSSALFERLDEIHGELEKLFIFAYKYDLLLKEQNLLKTELQTRGYDIRWM